MEEELEKEYCIEVNSKEFRLIKKENYDSAYAKFASHLNSKNRMTDNIHVKYEIFYDEEEVGYVVWWGGRWIARDSNENEAHHQDVRFAAKKLLEMVEGNNE